MSFLCMTRNKEVSYHQCINECQYFFKSACIDKMNEAYNQALEDIFDLAKQNAYDDGVDYSIGLQKLDELIANIRK